MCVHTIYILRKEGEGEGGRDNCHTCFSWFRLFFLLHVQLHLHLHMEFGNRRLHASTRDVRFLFLQDSK